MPSGNRPQLALIAFLKRGQVVRRWTRLFPLRDKQRQPIEPTEQWIGEKAADARWMATARKRLANLGWFMKSLKEPLARLANKQDGCRSSPRIEV